MKTLNEIYELAEEHGVTVDCFHLWNTESLSHMDVEGDCFIAIDPLLIRNESDEKIKLTHELGHCIQGAFYNQHATCDIRERHEARADRWMIKQLVPFPVLLDAMTCGYVDPWDLADYFEVPEPTMRKAIELYKDRLSMENTYYDTKGNDV